jgi:hypothetical protein
MMSARTTTEVVPLGEATEARVRLQMAAGDLGVKAADLGSDVVRGEFKYAPASFEPDVETTEESGTIEVDISQPSLDGPSLWRGKYLSDWSVELTKQVPMGLDVALGAGNTELDLRGVDLTYVQADMGAGDLMLDLSGPRTRDMDAWVTAGLGSAEIRLPSDVGVRVAGRQDGIGDWVYDGFEEDGPYLVNDAYGKSDTTIELRVQRGVGEVELVLVD